MSDGFISGKGKIDGFARFGAGVPVAAPGAGGDASLVAVLQSGLPLVLRGGQPVIPPSSISRSSILWIKRVIDVLIGCLAIVALLPLFVVVAAAIKLTSRGPVIFKQQRVGLGGRTFQLLKFRSLQTKECDASGVEQVVENDPRLTPIGRFLRVSSLDELPQLLNIISGEMSLVGPRPQVAGQLAAGRPYVELVRYYDLRYSVMPGLTGWAQANGLRGPTVDPVLAKARVDHDIAYIQNLSLILDLRILGRTIVRELFARNTPGI